jgi:hypothetical protein
MKKKIAINLTVILLVLVVFNSCKKEIAPATEDQIAKAMKPAENLPASVTLFATGLNNPRGLEWGPDGNLYVAEAGIGGSTQTVGQCEQAPFPFGPYRGSATGGRISKITSGGVRTTVTDQLPTTVSNPIINDIMGVADITFIGNQMYALLAGAGCAHGVATVPNGIVKVNSNGSWSVVADLGAFQHANPVAHPEADDFEPEGTWYSLTNAQGNLYALEPNHGELVKVTTDGVVSRVVDISASQGHIVPTALEYKGNFFVGNLNVFPIVDGSSKIFKVNPDGGLKEWATGFTTILGIVFDNSNRMYVLENTTGNDFPTPGTGRVIRVNPNGTKDVVATGLNLPTGIAMGPDGNLYISAWGFGRPPGGGEVVRVNLN